MNCKNSKQKKPFCKQYTIDVCQCKHCGRDIAFFSEEFVKKLTNYCADTGWCHLIKLTRGDGSIIGHEKVDRFGCSNPEPEVV